MCLFGILKLMELNGFFLFDFYEYSLVLFIFFSFIKMQVQIFIVFKFYKVLKDLNKKINFVLVEIILF